MKRSVLLPCTLAAIACAVSLVAGVRAEVATTPAPVKVMSFNIRYATAADGENAWEHRRGFVLETIRTFAPDLLGAQEVLAGPAAFLREGLPGYGFHGVGRDDGSVAGEFAPVFWRKTRFERVAGGHFWLSETPDAPGSRGWDAACVRMVSWVTLADREAGGRRFLFANTHFDHRGAEARVASARLLDARLRTLAQGAPVVLTGDFNCTEDDPPYAMLVGEAPGLVDAYRAAHPERTSLERTGAGWGGERKGSRIDWILHSHGWTTLTAMIDVTNDRGRYPSDHFPVEAVLRLRGETR
jgi:endonuclease/exonuclease/phosphatase family metal-dependent hydrolase